ncbi:MAG TPA: hypothetical protein RMF84_17095 [Polyangiaceae bacterium LLY-WYZ-14_1]|nr:hypothetical protein [Polyangiaceae bacterium LLY-WYZ-14_1]
MSTDADLPLGLPPELGEPVSAVQEAQRKPGFRWHTIDRLSFLEVAGARYFPTPEARAGRRVRRGGQGRWLAVLLVVLPVLGLADTWVSSDSLTSKLGLTLVLALIAALGVFVYRALGPEEVVVPGIARAGLYVFPEYLVFWLPRADRDELRLVVPRGQVRRFLRSGDAGDAEDAGNADDLDGRDAATLIVAFERRSGELDQAPTGLPAPAPADLAWLERWRETGRLDGAA